MMKQPLTPNDIVPPTHNEPHNDLEMLIDLINTNLQDKTYKTSYPYDNDDGTFDRFRCVIYFDGNAPKNEDYREYRMWCNYHAEIMDLYRKAGWIVKRWEDATHFNHSSESPVPKYCLALLQTPASKALLELQDKVLKP